MNELLTVIVDLSLETLKTVDPVKLLQEVSIFMNAYQLQSSRNQVRLYVSFPLNSYLVFPIDDD